MSYLLRALVIAFALLAALPGSATGKLAEPPEGAEEWVPLAQAIALDFWERRGHTACSGVPVRVKWHERGTLGGHMATAYLDGCARGLAHVNVSEFLAAQRFARRCGSFVHEYGHLVGLDHDAPYRVMRASWIPPECVPAERAERRAQKLRRIARKARRAWRRNQAARLAKRYAHAARLHRALAREVGA